MNIDKKLNLRKQTIMGVNWMSLYTLSNVLVNLIATSILARLLSASEFGMVTAVLVIVSFADIFGSLGAGPSLVYMKNLSNKDIWTAISLTHIFSAIVYLTIFLGAPFLGNFFNIRDFTEVIRILGLIFLIKSFSVVPESILQKHMKFKELSIIRFLSLSFIYSIVAVSLALNGAGYWSLVYAHITATLVYSVLLVSTFCLKYKFKYRLGFNAKSCSNILNYGFGMTLANVVSNFALQGDNLIVTRLLGEAAVGIYSKAYQLITYPVNMIGKIFDQVFFPMLSSVRGQRNKVINVYYKITRSFSLFSIFVSVIITTCSLDIVNVYLGPNWEMAAGPIMIFGYSFFFRLSYKIGDLVSKSHGAVYNRALRTFFYAVLVIVGSIIGSKWGIQYVAIGVSIAIAINYFLMTSLSLKLINEKWSKFILNLLPIIILYVAVLVIANIVHYYSSGFGSMFRIIIILFVVPTSMIILIMTIFRNYFSEEKNQILNVAKLVKRIIYSKFYNRNRDVNS
ncbi:lipopolysaccharide biosynthesis protein [Priestia megaterium]|uniref:lipopolysaccharide biosynthesis protein n=1 Tax=Priestia megaterium TaxID=1404 RepID=UPI0028647A58|nr:lipopolysaccharide biosynthesis protein [Priestia megaterium]MDR7204820.1 PST family polysaccharide transporter [Priestia megaterium]